MRLREKRQRDRVRQSGREIRGKGKSGDGRFSSAVATMVQVEGLVVSPVQTIVRQSRPDDFPLALSLPSLRDVVNVEAFRLFLVVAVCRGVVPGEYERHSGQLHSPECAQGLRPHTPQNGACQKHVVEKEPSMETKNHDHGVLDWGSGFGKQSHSQSCKRMGPKLGTQFRGIRHSRQEETLWLPTPRVLSENNSILRRPALQRRHGRRENPTGGRPGHPLVQKTLQETRPNRLEGSVDRHPAWQPHLLCAVGGCRSLCHR